MRALLCLCCLLVTGLWLVPASVGASDAADRAERLENSLQAVEWYTNESVRKALQAETTGDEANAQLFGNKAIESDLKAQGLRQQTAEAWQLAGKPTQAQAVWHRAADMARERAVMLEKRIPTLLRQWQLADGSGNAAGEREYEIRYLQAVFYTAQHWGVVAQFSEAAGEPEQQRTALEQLQILLPRLQRDNRLMVLADDPRLAGCAEHLQRWQQQVAAIR